MDSEPKHALNLSIQLASRTSGLPTRQQLRRWTKAALMTSARLTIRLVDSREGRRMNREFRHKDTPTNVLTFAYGLLDNTLEGDIVLCAPVVKREAQYQKKPLAHHYAHLVVHGLLHLQGYDHLKRHDAQHMEAMEIQILERLRIPNPYLSFH
ncbi:MAG: rRNA maturation RNase YbeY [Betaproteobacteria bacterium]|nr:rRNA maturation RNase YbeY [Betaproteobacteria bacterium]